MTDDLANPQPAPGDQLGQRLAAVLIDDGTLTPDEVHRRINEVLHDFCSDLEQVLADNDDPAQVAVDAVHQATRAVLPKADVQATIDPDNPGLVRVAIRLPIEPGIVTLNLVDADGEDV